MLDYAMDGFKGTLRQTLSSRLIHQLFLALNFEAELLFQKLVWLVTWEYVIGNMDFWWAY